MIKGVLDERTAAAFAGDHHRGLPPDIRRAARRKLMMLDAATQIEHLRVPPGNRLERLVGNRAETWSIRVNDQWRICFRWEGGDAYDVQLVDYH